MADFTKEELRKEIADILKDANLETTTSRKVRQQLEEKLDCTLSERKKEIDDLVMEFLFDKEEKTAKNSGSEDGEEEEEEEEEKASEEEEKEVEKKKPAKREPAKKATPKRKKASSEEDESASASDDDDDSEEYSPRKSTAKKAKPAKKGKKSKKANDDSGSEADSGSDADWAKSKKKSGGGKKKAGGGGKGSGYTRQLTLSPALAAIVGANQMARYEVVKKLWAVIKEKNLFDPKNKQFAICDDDLFKVIGVKRFRTFAMMKYLKDHFVD